MIPAALALVVGKIAKVDVAAGILFSRTPLFSPGFRVGDGVADADGPAGGSIDENGSADGTVSFCSGAGTVGVVTEACDALVVDAGPADGRLDGNERTRAAADEGEPRLTVVGS